ncbi:hypothetical protein BDN70DRAFT_934117 [Pholiota conissans]|uniref:Uncharacterized protein n=1 Tax=Pholiota conissans TaxID=109636 RepID=A0A9P6CZD4_9AGAR|nr:hypothetical protein BDN70DRAFT_934117 [Pholiota conissans]
MKMLYSQIPQELNDEIIGFLWDDKVALKACALTCQSFLPASQKQLFSDISIFLSSHRAPTRESTGTHLRRLLEATPYLAEYVHRLEIHDLSRPCHTEEWLTYDRDLIYCLRHLRNLTALKIRCRDGKFEAQRWNHIRHGGLLEALLETLKLPTLTSLDFDCLPFSLVSQCSILKQLTIRSPDADLVIDNALPFSESVHPESLRLDLREPSDTSRKSERPTNWGDEIRRSPIDLTAVKALTIVTTAREWEEQCGAWPALKASASTLETLALEIEASPGMFMLDTPFNAYQAVQDPLDWSTLKALRVLHARVTVVAAQGQWGLGFCNLLPWVAGLLRELTSSGPSDVEELVIQVNYKFLDNRMVPVLLPWKGLLSLVCEQARFPRLQRTRVMIASESKLPFQCTGIVQQIARYSRAMGDGRHERVSISISDKCFTTMIRLRFPWNNLTTRM